MKKVHKEAGETHKCRDATVKRVTLQKNNGKKIIKETGAYRE